MSDKILRPYGTWESPLTPLSIGRGVRFSDLAWSQDGALVWHEGRSDHGVLVVQPPDGQAQRDLNSDYDVRARVGYGGGDFSLSGGYAFFIDAASSRVLRQPLRSGAAEPLTPAFGQAACPCLSPDGRWLVYVHSEAGRDCLALVDAQGSLWPQKLAEGHDFYMQPVWHPDSKRLAWISWNHPNMPWDGTWLYLGSLERRHPGLPVIDRARLIAGGDAVSIFQPEFSPDGRWLAYAGDQNGWWHLYLYDLESGEQCALTRGEAEHAVPAWIQGRRTYCFAPDGKNLVYLRNEKGFASLWRLELSSGKSQRIPLDKEYTWLEQPAISPDGTQVALLASGGRTPARLIVTSLDGKARVVRRSAAEDIPADAYSAPQAVAWQASQAGRVHGLFYPPQNLLYEGEGPPPLVVLVHGGPTSQRTAAFDPQVQFFTSRGYAVLQANYRGSTGYGRAYREQLYGNWGLYDVEDCVNGVQYLTARGLVDGKRAVIMGGSSGGFTVLQALVDHPGFFKAGIGLYAVSNQFSLVQATHKFEAHYSDRLLGALPQAADLYRQRSPIFFADRIQDPVALFQGDKDVVVPRAQSDEMVASLERRGVPHIYHVYEGEGHGFRKSETIQHFYEQVERFLLQYVVYA